jgi:hypothetical protein
MRTFVPAAMVCLVSLASVSGARADILSDSARFDRVYIPALALTSQGEADGSRSAMARLKPAWHVFAQAHERDQPGDLSWTRSFGQVAKQIEEADSLVAAGKLSEAHEALEQVRILLMELRHKHHIAYFPDLLTAFHEPMEEIVLTVKGKTPATLTSAQRGTIKALLPELERRWQAVLGAGFKPALFGFSPERTAKAKQLMEAETQAIARLRKALDDQGSVALLPSGMAIKPAFAQLYMLFGEFKPQQKG